jgi:hypothetical protein
MLIITIMEVISRKKQTLNKLITDLIHQTLEEEQNKMRTLKALKKHQHSRLEN